MFFGRRKNGKQNKPMTEQELVSAQAAWAGGIVEIGDAFTQGGDYRARASQLLDDLYAYNMGSVLFKPTKASEWQFRGTKEDALSYFVSGHVDEDHGFAINPGWIKVRFENAGMSLNGPVGLAMGNYYFTDPDGDETKVEFAFGYIRDEQGKVRINLHHSSIPYKA